MTDLDELLRETFTAHEHLADTDRAVSLAREPRRFGHHVARVLLAAVAVAAVVVTGTLIVQSQPSFHSERTAPLTTPTVDEKTMQAQQNEANVAAARQHAVELLDRLPTLPGAIRHDQAPGSTLAEPSVSLAGVPATTTWWTAPGTSDEAVAFFLNHPPEGLVTDGNTAGVYGEVGPKVHLVEYTDPEVPSQSAPRLLVEIAPAADGVVVRADAYVPPEAARLASSYVEDVTSVEITVLKGTEVASHMTVGDPTQVERLAAEFNSLRAYWSFVHSCPVQLGDPAVRRLVFHTSTGDLIANEPPFTCSHTLRIFRAGQALDQVTESLEFQATLDAVAPLP